MSRRLTQTRADLHRLSERTAANHTAKSVFAELSQDPPATLRTAAEVLQTRPDPLPADDRQIEWQRLLHRLNETDQAALPAALVQLRDAFLAASSTRQTEALAAELRRQIQHLNQAHRVAIQQQLEQEQQIVARHYTQQVIGETLAELGYAVGTGFATLFVEGGVAHIQQPDWGDYYVRLWVKPEAGDLNLNVVRVSADRTAPSNEQARRDRDMEEHWCAAHRELLHRLEQRGIASQPLRTHRRGNYQCNAFNRTRRNTPVWRECSERAGDYGSGSFDSGASQVQNHRLAARLRRLHNMQETY